jgi:RND family efflux transporter MFP subunit
MVIAKNQYSKPFLGLALVLSVLTTACNSSKSQTEAAGPQALPVKTKTVSSGLVSDSTEYVGNLEAQQRVRLAPRIEGRILRILVKNGDRVTTGQSIVELQPTREEENVKAAASQVNIEKANLNASQAEWRAAQAEVARSDALVEQARADVARAEADIQNTKAELELAQKNYARSVALVKEGAQAQQTLDERTSNLNARKARYEAQLKTRDSAKQSLNAALTSKKAVQTQVEQALATIDSRKAAVSRAEGELGVSNQNLEFNNIKAPIAGVVGDFPVKVGDYVRIGDELTTIANNQTFDLNLNIPTEKRSQLRTGLPVEIVDADGKAEVKGQITSIAPNVNNTNQTILAKATFQNDGSLRDSEYVKAKVIWKRQPGVLVPTVAVSRIGAQSFVFVAQQGKNPEGKSALVAKQKPVTLGNIQGQEYPVLSGIKQGDKVITSGLLSLRDGAPVAEEALTSEQNKEAKSTAEQNQ